MFWKLFQTNKPMFDDAFYDIGDDDQVVTTNTAPTPTSYDLSPINLSIPANDVGPAEVEPSLLDNGQTNICTDYCFTLPLGKGTK